MAVRARYIDFVNTNKGALGKSANVKLFAEEILAGLSWLRGRDSPTFMHNAMPSQQLKRTSGDNSRGRAMTLTNISSFELSITDIFSSASSASSNVSRFKVMGSSRAVFHGTNLG
jgi:hypothetical protein